MFVCFLSFDLFFCFACSWLITGSSIAADIFPVEEVDAESAGAEDYKDYLAEIKQKFDLPLIKVIAKLHD